MIICIRGVHYMVAYYKFTITLIEIEEQYWWFPLETLY